MRTCSADEFCTKSYISCVSSFICSLPVEGGGPGRREAQVILSNKNAFTLPYIGSIGGRLGVSRLIQAISPFAWQSASIFAQSAGVPTALLVLSVLPRAINACATSLPRAPPAAKSLRTLAPANNLAC